MLTSVRIRDFKSFKDSTLVFNSGLTLLYGSNGAGKSNFVDALRLLRAPGEGRSVRDAIEGHTSAGSPSALGAVEGIRGGGAALSHFTSASDICVFELVLQTDRGRILYDVAIDVPRYRVAAERLVADRHYGQYVFHSDWPDTFAAFSTEDEPDIKAKVHTGRQGRNPDRLFSSHEPVLSQFRGRKAETAYNETFARVVAAELARISPLELRPEVLRQYSPLGRFHLGEHGENFAAVSWQLIEMARGTTRTRTRNLSRPRPHASTRSRVGCRS